MSEIWLLNTHSCARATYGRLPRHADPQVQDTGAERARDTLLAIYAVICWCYFRQVAWDRGENIATGYSRILYAIDDRMSGIQQERKIPDFTVNYQQCMRYLNLLPFSTTEFPILFNAHDRYISAINVSVRFSIRIRVATSDAVPIRKDYDRRSSKIMN